MRARVCLSGKRERRGKGKKRKKKEKKGEMCIRDGGRLEKGGGEGGGLTSGMVSKKTG